MTKKTGEQWKPITHYKDFVFTGRYEISSWGNIRNRETKAPLATYDSQRGHGYLKTKIRDTKGVRRMVYIHTLVAIYFLDAPDEEGLELNHIDGNSLNNSYTNLEWITHKENMREWRRLQRSAS